MAAAAASAFAELITKEADNNVKLIVLDRFDQLRAKHDHVLDGMVMDILKVLSSQDLEVKRRAIQIALEMITSRNVEDVVLFLRKQLQGTMDQDFDKVSRRPIMSRTVLTNDRTSSTANSSSSPSTHAPYVSLRSPPTSCTFSWTLLATRTTPPPWTSSPSSERWWRSSPNFDQLSRRNSSKHSRRSRAAKYSVERCGSLANTALSRQVHITPMYTF